MLRTAAFLFLMAVGAVGLAGCSGFSDEEATARCQQEQTARGAGACFDSSTLATCVAAYKDCGTSAQININQCPLTYSCDDGSGGGGGSAATTSATTSSTGSN